MPWRNDPDLWALLGALLISMISGFISIAQRIARGHTASSLWIISEFMAAILCGYLAYDVYPTIKDALPKWITLPIFVALAAHVAGRCFQEIEGAIYRKYGGALPGPGRSNR